MPAVTAAKKAGVILVKFPEDEGGWSKAVIVKIVPPDDPAATSGTHWVHYEGEEVLRVVRLSEGRYSCADDAKHMSWVALARGGGRRGSGSVR